MSTHKISGPRELLHAVPTLLGFVPRESLVLVGLNDGRLIVTARVDLADVDHLTLRRTLGAMAKADTTQLVAVQASDDPDFQELSRDVAAVAQTLAIDTIDAMWWDTKRNVWGSAMCEDPTCCPIDGKPVGEEITAFQAAAAVNGVTVAPTREALTNELATLPLGRVIIERMVERAQLTDDPVPALIERLKDDHEFSDTEVAVFGKALANLDYRDAIWHAIEGGLRTPHFAELSRRLPEQMAAGARFLYAWQWWRSGDGGRANIGLAHCIESDPDYSAAKILAAALAQGINPANVRPMVTS